MGKSCCAVGCANRYTKGSGIHFYRFPEKAERRARWIAAVGRKNWAPNEHSWICSVHFVSGIKSNDPLSPDYVPSVFCYTKSSVKRKLASDMERYERKVEAKKRRVENCDRLAAASSLLALSEDGNGSAYCEPHTGLHTLTSLTMADIDKLERENDHLKSENMQLRKECEWLKDENSRLAKETDVLKIDCQKLRREHEQLTTTNRTLEDTIRKQSLNEEFFENNNAKVKYYTGLPTFTTLMAIFTFVSTSLEDNSRTVLSHFQQFLSVLMKLRLNLGDQDLGYRFGVNQSTISRYFKKWINVMYVRLSPLVKWPSREELIKTMPMEFRTNFKQCVVIIDCFEIFIERPTNLKARAQTWSNYKHHNTVKFLIGISPQGAISFISKGWGGRVSDVHLTENCGILDKLLPGDLILADRGFNIHESAGLFCAQVKIPPFTKGKNQLSKTEVDNSRQLSRVRIHVERIIGVVRQKFTILESTLPINLIMCTPQEDISVIDKVVTICCALCNCCDSVVSME